MIPEKAIRYARLIKSSWIAIIFHLLIYGNDVYKDLWHSVVLYILGYDIYDNLSGVYHSKSILDSSC